MCENRVFTEGQNLIITVLKHLEMVSRSILTPWLDRLFDRTDTPSCFQTRRTLSREGILLLHLFT